ncbi:MAG: phosphoribosylanthranilate isomerase [Aquabacterium sp.]|nr:phosphoribosylanthranilate isomerase [Aquabacterium sp.]
MTHRTRIKICGLTREADVEAAAEAGADAVGFVLYARSPRHVSPARALQLARRLPPYVTPVLLFVNHAVDEVRAILRDHPGALAQFHGDETPEHCETAAGAPYRYVRAVRMTPDVDLQAVAQAHPGAQALLLDAHVDGYGGAGRAFDWSWVRSRARLPYILAAGLTPDNVADGVQRVRPWAVDVSSGVEASRGIKDTALMRRFCQAVRDADARIADLPRDEAVVAAPQP